jgi:hypothetical protein
MASVRFVGHPDKINYGPIIKFLHHWAAMNLDGLSDGAQVSFDWRIATLPDDSNVAFPDQRNAYPATRRVGGTVGNPVLRRSCCMVRLTWADAECSAYPYRACLRACVSCWHLCDMPAILGMSVHRVPAQPVDASGGNPFLD